MQRRRQCPDSVLGLVVILLWGCVAFLGNVDAQISCPPTGSPPNILPVPKSLQMPQPQCLSVQTGVNFNNTNWADGNGPRTAVDANDCCAQCASVDNCNYWSFQVYFSPLSLSLSLSLSLVSCLSSLTLSSHSLTHSLTYSHLHRSTRLYRVRFATGLP